MLGQMEADEMAAKAREEARAKSEAASTAEAAAPPAEPKP